MIHVAAGAVLGFIFGIAAQISRFCLRRAVAGDVGARTEAGAVWLTALVTAILGFFIASQFGLVALNDHRLLASELPVLSIALGGVLFGAGMVLTRGCVSRLTVLSGTGNLRAVTVLILFAVVAHATLKGVLAPMRVALGSVTIPTPVTSLFDAPILAALLVITAVFAVYRLATQSGASWGNLGLGAVIGLTPVLGWMATSTLLFDEFDPLPVQSMAFTLPWTDTLFWAIASTSIPASFGVGMVGGVLGGAFLSALFRGELALQSFESPQQTLRYSGGAALMGLGGVLAGGCTVGAGLSGSAMLSVAALLALTFIVVGAVIMNRLLHRNAIAVPAE